MKNSQIIKQHSITKKYLLITFAILLLAIGCLLTQRTENFEAPVDTFPTATPTATVVPLPANIEEVRARCSTGECVSACMARVGDEIRKEAFILPAYDAEDDIELVYYSISKTDQLVKPRNFDVSGDLLSLRDDISAHEFIWSYFKKLFSRETRPNLVTFGMYVSSTSDGKFDTTLTENWIMKVNVLALEDVSYLSDALVHEYGHYLTLNRGQEDKNIGYRCKQKALYFCQAPDSYLNLFYLDFWEDIYPEWADIDQDSIHYDDAIQAFYEKYKDRFVSQYASTDPIEDIAETWTSFVLEPTPSGNSVADQKINFFYKFPALVDLRYQIINGICTYNGRYEDQ